MHAVEIHFSDKCLILSFNFSMEITLLLKFYMVNVIVYSDYVVKVLAHIDYDFFLYPVSILLAHPLRIVGKLEPI